MTVLPWNGGKITAVKSFITLAPRSHRVNKSFSQRIYHVGYTSSHMNTEVKQHWAWILLGWETLQGIPGSAGTYPHPPLPPADRVQSFLTLFVSIK